MSFVEQLARLAPAPRSARAGASAWQPAQCVRLVDALGYELQGTPALEALRERLASRGVTLEPRGEPQLRCEFSALLTDEAYTLELCSSGALLRAAGAAGFAYGLRTLAQWLAVHAEHDDVPGVVIEDSPSFTERGVMLDVARDRRPTLATLFALVERFASLKYNRLQLYMEADFAYSFGALATQGRSPYAAHELRELDAYCAARQIELVPNQQSFGHMHHWLRHPQWNALAEVPEGLEHPFSDELEPFSLCPEDPGSALLLGRMYDELLECFSSKTFNVGLDETFDLGQGRSRAACEARGRHALYLDYLREVHGLVSARGKRMQFWGDIILERPELCAELPGDAVALAWGYEAEHPFDRELEALARSNHEFHVCPGTSSWNGFVGRTANALGNLRNAARHGARHGARGYLVTDWGDRGHLQPPVISAPGFTLGAALAWNAESEARCEREQLAAWLDDWWFEDRGRVLGHATLELGRLQELMGERCKNGTAAFFMVVFGDRGLDDEHFEGLTRAGLERARVHLEHVLDPLERVDSTRADAGLVVRELELARDLARLGVELGLARLAAGGVLLAQLAHEQRSAFATQLRELVARHRELWPLRQRPGGLEQSVRWLEASLPLLTAPASGVTS